MDKHVLFYSPQMQELAEEIVRRHGERVELGSIEFASFPDGAPNTRIRRANALVPRHVSFLMCFDDWNAFFEQLSAHYHLAGLAPRSYRVILPFFKTGTMERCNDQDQVITAKTLLTALGACGPSGPGRVPVYTYDVHALAIESFVGDHLVFRFKTGLKLLFQALEARGGADKLTIAFPDDGAKKRFGEMQALLDAKERLGFQIAVCGKNRIGEIRQVHLQEGIVIGRDVVIIDDLIRSAGTLFECARVLRAAGARNVDAYATHVSEPDQGWKKFDGGIIRTLYMTDSCPEAVKAVVGNPHVEVLGLADSIFNAIVEGASS